MLYAFALSRNGQNRIGFDQNNILLNNIDMIKISKNVQNIIKFK